MQGRQKFGYYMRTRVLWMFYFGWICSSVHLALELCFGVRWKSMKSNKIILRLREHILKCIQINFIAKLTKVATTLTKRNQKSYINKMQSLIIQKKISNWSSSLRHSYKIWFNYSSDIFTPMNHKLITRF